MGISFIAKQPASRINDPLTTLIGAEPIASAQRASKGVYAWDYL